MLGDVHKAGEAVSISAWTPSAAYTAVYAAPDDVAKVAAPVYSKVEKKGLHVETREWKRPCSCGTYPTFETDVREYEVVPDVFVKRVRVGREASSRDVSEGRVSLLKGENQHLEYTVAASRKASPECALCAATASAEALADVYELSVSMESEYLGLDMTDAARGHQVSRTATARIDPNPKSGNHAVYRWTDCGTRCEWSSSLSASTVKYRTDGSKGPSSRYREEPLVVEGTVYTQNWLGPKVSAACTNRFTIVRVDVQLGDWLEQADEKNGEMISSFVERGVDAIIGGYPPLAKEEMTKFPVSIGVMPNSLPKDEAISIVYSDNEIITGVDQKVSKSCHTIGEVADMKFYLFDGTGSSGKKKFSALHDNSAAHDMITYDACCCVFAVFADCTSSITGHSFWKIEVDESHLKLLPDHLRPYVGVYGFYPAQIGGDKTESYYLAPGQLRKDDFLYREHFVDQAQTSRTAHHVWHISFRRCIDGLEEVHSIASKKPKYDLSNYNCTDVAISVGRACGVPLQDAGFPDFSLFEIIREVIGDDENWTNDRDGSFSSPLGLLVNLKYNNFLYGVIE